MSWSASIVIPKGSTAEQAWRAITDALPVGNDDCPDERREQLHLAQVQAGNLLESGCLGPVEACGWEVFLSGHANPGHEQRREWSSERVQVTVQQQTLGPVTQIAAGESGKAGDR